MLFLLVVLRAESQPRYLVTGSWTVDHIQAVEDSIKSMVGTNYTMTKMDIRLPAQTVMYQYTDYADNRELYVEMSQGFINGNYAMGKKPDTVFSGVRISGLYIDVFKIYKQMFAPKANAEEIIKHVMVPTFGIMNNKIVDFDVTGGQKPGEVVVQFERSGGFGMWRLTIKGPGYRIY